MVFFSRVGNRVESSESFQEARIMSSAEVVGAPAGDTGGTAIEVAVGKRGRQPLTGAERCRRTRLKKSAAAGGAAAPTQRGNINFYQYKFKSLKSCTGGSRV